jgi:AraC-like DNA-binding protein
VRQNYSYLKGVDISWVSYTFAFYITLQLVWLLITVVGSPVEDAIYYLMTVVFWELFLRKCLTLQPLSYKEMAEMVEEQNLRKQPLPSYYSFATNFERVMIEEQIYLRSDLKLGDLAKRFNTNRTYLSTYFTNVVKQTFYDYINGLRIEQKGIPLMKEHPEYSLDYVAEQSGFNSQSTFRRAFKKKTGQTPREFLSELGNDNER